MTSLIRNGLLGWVDNVSYNNTMCGINANKQHSLQLHEFLAHGGCFFVESSEQLQPRQKQGLRNCGYSSIHIFIEKAVLNPQKSIKTSKYSGISPQIDGILSFAPTTFNLLRDL